MRRPTIPARTGHRVAAAWVASCCALWSICAAARASDAPWELRYTDDATGTQVYIRDRGADAPEFRAVARMRTRLSTLVAVLMDTEHMPEWVYRTHRVTRIERSSPTQGISQVITAMPWPLKDREAIVAWRLTQEPPAGVVTIEGRSAPDRLPSDEHMVRMPSFESRWRFEPLDGGIVEVRFEGHGNPGGSLALPVLREFVHAAVWEAPLYTVNSLGRMIERDEYRDAVLPFIREPGH